ncbi:hypothetical protein D3C85_349700 [compost metagenome]
MDFMQTILSSPLPIAVCAVITLACLAGYWFFVIPLLEEVKTLRDSNTELQKKLGDEFELQKANVQKFMQELATSLQSQQNVTDLVTMVGALKSAVEQQSTALSGVMERMFHEVRDSLDKLGEVLDTASDSSKHDHTDIQREVERLTRLLESLARQVSDISDKQSQVAGVLTGMSMVKSMNRGL